MLAVVFVGCSKSPEESSVVPDSDALALVGNASIHYDQVEDVAMRRGYNLFSGSAEQALNDAIDQEALAIEAKAAGYFDDPEILRLIRAHAVQKMLGEKITKNLAAEITDTDLKTYFETHRDQFDQPATVRGQVLYLIPRSDSRGAKYVEKLEAAKAGIESGQDFSDLIRTLSDNPADRKRLGDTNWISETKGSRRLPPEVVEKLFTMQVGEVTPEPVETEQGLYFIKLQQRNDRRPAEFEKLKNTIRQTLIEARHNEAYREYVDNLRQKYEVTIFEQRLEEELTTRAQANNERTGPPMGPVGRNE